MCWQSNNALCQDALLADQWNSKLGSEIVIWDVKEAFQGLNDECFNLLVAIVSEAEADDRCERMEFLMEFQGAVGSGFCLQVLQDLFINVRALITLERLWLCCIRLIVRSEDWLIGKAAMMLMVLEGKSQAGSDAQLFVGQEDLSWGRKLPCDQKPELIRSQVEPDLVSRSARSRTPKPVVGQEHRGYFHEYGSVEHWRSRRIDVSSSG